MSPPSGGIPGRESMAAARVFIMGMTSKHRPRPIVPVLKDAGNQEGWRVSQVGAGKKRRVGAEGRDGLASSAHTSHSCTRA